MLLRMIVLASLLAFCGCGPAPEPVTFTEVRDDLLLLSCALSSCHGTGTGDLTLDAEDPGAVYAALVGVASSERPELNLVEPGDPDNSYLVMKLEQAEAVTAPGTGTEVEQLDPVPPPFSLLGSDPDMVDRVRAWIEDGATDN